MACKMAFESLLSTGASATRFWPVDRIDRLQTRDTEWETFQLSRFQNLVQIHDELKSSANQLGHDSQTLLSFLACFEI
jgi:hypothetical protein